ncbi:BREX system ATP-binding domain-containing protein [Tepidiforma thermophila]|uniref:P-loop uncharacterized protein DUF2791 n=1 Tax=Tepidiforma thermophila (strain KCTC 52669 / CGMCC 1.13589 / G233) TaxID=2761530 RepID=A0A2A9HDR1_TEPT2|nr:BREX system ATP-binding domain-containing protein [Tepidiforma thermophila]PFG73250.1 P-loop uncharacterized protein DUF2791 [Tepidiforma thermophila]
MTMTYPLDIDARRATEALRNGVPNRFAVAALGSWQTEAVSRFEALCGQGDAGPRGMMVRGDFGTGKSHLLMLLRERARSMGYATAMVVVSKELPLGNPSRLIPRILLEAELPDMPERGLPVIASRLNFNTRAYAEFFRWADQWQFGDGWWSATLALYERLRSATEVLDSIARFWAGEPALTASLVRQHLRESGLAGAHSIGKLPSAESLNWQRLTFGARLCGAVGLRGLVVFVDEIELIAQYSRLQRIKAYGMLGHLLGGAPRPELADAPLVVVGAVTRDFDEAVLVAKGDADEAPGVARQKYGEQAAEAVSAAISAIRGSVPLTAPTNETIEQLLHKVTVLYHQAYPDWTPTRPQTPELHSTTTVRSVIRRWITDWDLRRYYGTSGEIVETDIGATRTEEDEELAGDEE